MAKYCPKCGTKLDSEYKFCPSCGFDLTGLKSAESDSESGNFNSPSNSNSKNEVIVCEMCGEENDPQNSVCSSCGVKLQGERKILDTTKKNESKEESRPKQEFKQNKVSKPHKNKKAPQQNISKTSANRKSEKSLSQTTILVIILVAIGIGIVILIASGIFNTPVAPTQNVASQQQTNSGVDLANVQKINDLEKQLAANPKDTTLILQLAHLKNDANMFQQAIVNYKQYLALVPKDPDARIDMGICYYNLRDYKTAIKEMEQAISYAPKHQIGYLDLGIVSLTAGNMDKAKEYLKKAVSLDPASDAGKKAQELLQSHMNTNK